MKEKFGTFIGKIIIPMCFIMICNGIFRDYIDLIPNLYLLPLRILLLLGSISIVIAGLIKAPIPMIGKSTCYDKKSLRKRFYMNSDVIVEKVFIWYIVLYVFLRLDKISIYFSFLMLLIFGVFYGYRIAKMANTCRG